MCFAMLLPMGLSWNFFFFMLLGCRWRCFVHFRSLIHFSHTCMCPKHRFLYFLKIGPSSHPNVGYDRFPHFRSLIFSQHTNQTFILRPTNLSSPPRRAPWFFSSTNFRSLRVWKALKDGRQTASTLVKVRLF